MLERLLVESNYPRMKTQFLVEGFTNGFDIGYRGPTNRRDTSRNLPFQEGVGNKTELYKKIMKEVKLGRYAGPFQQIPFRNYIQSPVGLVPKAGNQTRLIFHLSHNFKETCGPSVNACTPREWCKVHYKDIDYAVETSYIWRNLNAINCEGNQVLIYYSKTDLKSAFRILPLMPSCICWLVIKAINPATNQLEYFADKNLPFGSSISCCLFQKFSDALRHIVEFQSGRQQAVTNYLDDFLFVAPTTASCNGLVRQFLNICDDIGVPVATEKTEEATEIITFLGLLLNGRKFLITVPEAKRLKAFNWLQKIKCSKKATIHELEKLTGLLNFLSKAIVPGRTFTRRMYAKYANSDNRDHKLRKFHHVSLDKEFKEDCEIWNKFLTMNDATSISRPFADIMDFDDSTLQIQFHSDATANGKLGFGIIFDQAWTYQNWEKNFVQEYKPNIEFLELYALTMGVFIWSEKLTNRRVILFCDNKGVVGMMNSTVSKCKYCMVLIRMVILRNLNYNFRIFAEHIKGDDNYLSDRLSRMQIEEFKRLAKKDGRIIDDEPTPLNNEIWPLSVLWEEKCLPLK